MRFIKEGQCPNALINTQYRVKRLYRQFGHCSVYLITFEKYINSKNYKFGFLNSYFIMAMNVINILHI